MRGIRSVSSNGPRIRNDPELAREGYTMLTAAPELLYTGIKDLELRARVIVLAGKARTEFGEKQNAGRIEVYARWYF